MEPNVLMQGMLRTEAPLFTRLLLEGRDPIVLIQGEIRVMTTLEGHAVFDWQVEFSFYGFLNRQEWTPYTPLPLGFTATLCFCTIYATAEEPWTP